MVHWREKNDTLCRKKRYIGEEKDDTLEWEKATLEKLQENYFKTEETTPENLNVSTRTHFHLYWRILILLEGFSPTMVGRP